MIIICAAVLVAGYLYLKGKLDLIETEHIDIEDIGINTEITEELKGYRNIALLGIDTRADDYDIGNRSDCMIIASLNQKTNDIRLISIYRDSFIDVEENGKTILDKVTHAYSFGGAQNALKSLNKALDLNITEFVTVNFDAVIVAVEELDGIEIKIESDEIKNLNDYIDSTAKTSGFKSKHITSAGLQTLDGVQAVAYSRIRYTSGGDYRRTERMRTVVTAMLKKAKTLNIMELNRFTDVILPKIRTNISSNEIIKLLPTIASYNVVDSIGWPYETRGITLDRWYGVPVTLESNVVKLHKELFDQEDYEASDVVKDMSSRIIKKTGYSK